jgi:formyltetrahydrofolate deformylase
MTGIMTTETTPHVIATLFGPDRPGLVARVAGWIYDRAGNIIHADQHRDGEAAIFFQRLEWAPDGEAQEEARAFEAFVADELDMHVQVALTSDRPRVAVMVSKHSHCFHDLVLRFKAGEMPGRLVTVISNHPDLADETEQYGLPYHHVPVTAATKPEAESKQLDLLRAAGVDLIVLARYMQILTEDFLDAFGGPIINIHHSFLPAFTGARPYHQAYARGVKIIGATAHYATPELDQGPIINQDVVPVSHRHSPKDLRRRGRDLEKSVFAQAVRWHLENRILVYNNKTVVFD